MSDEIHIIIPDTSGSINVNVDSDTTPAEVDTPDTEGNIEYNTAGDKYYCDLAKDWAVKMTGKVQNEDYSSKYYAQQAKEAAAEEVASIEGQGTVKVEKTGGKVIITTKTFIFTQSVAASDWTITHNLNKRPTVTVVDSGGNTFFPPVEYTNDNVCVVHFLGATTGQAYLN